MPYLTAAERAKRYRQRKAGKALRKSPRAERKDDIEMLWGIAIMCGDRPGSLRNFYRKRAAVLKFMNHASFDIVRTRVAENPELIEYFLRHTLMPEWTEFVDRLEELGVPIKDKRHPLDEVQRLRDEQQGPA